MTTCAACGEEVRFGRDAIGTIWMHRPGSPGALDGHMAVLGRRAPMISRQLPPPAVDNELRVLERAYPIALEALPPSPARLARTLEASRVHVIALAARAARGADRIIDSVRVAATNPRSKACVSALWVHDDGLTRPAWKFDSAWIWGPGLETRKVAAASIVSHLLTPG